MAFIPTPNCILARLQWQRVTGVLAENRFYCATTSVPTATDLEEVGAAIQEWLTESIAPIVVDEWSAIGVICRAVNEEEGLEINYTTDFPVVGEDSNPPAPNNVSYTTTWNTGLVGRSARGRSYGVGLPMTATQDGNRLTDVSQGEFQGRWANLLTILEAAGHAMQVVSFVEDGVPRTEGRKLPVLSALVRFPLATQRRRYT